MLPALVARGFSGDMPMGWEAVRFHAPSLDYRNLAHAILTFLKPGLIAYGGGGLPPRDSVAKCQGRGQLTSQDNPGCDHQDIGTTPSDFLSHFVTWKNIVYLPIYLKSAQGRA